MDDLLIPAWYYQQFDMDFSLEYPSDGFGGWKKESLPFSVEHSALIVMHAWDTGSREMYPGWHRVVEYLPRSEKIASDVFPPIFKAVRRRGMSVVHVGAAGCSYVENHEGYKAACQITEKVLGKEVKGNTVHPLPKPEADPASTAISEFKSINSYTGTHNIDDVLRGFANTDFQEGTAPANNELVVDSSEQLLAVCIDRNINHLVYIGFALDGCLLTSPGGMVDMNRYGFLCSTIRQATTAIEFKGTSKDETAKKIALWRVGLMFGLVYEDTDFIKGME